MRILFLTSRLPYPPNRGDRLRVFYFLKTLSREHELHLISFISNSDELKYIEILKEYCRNVKVLRQSKINSFLSVGLTWWKPVPLQVLYYQSKKMEQLVSNELKVHTFDAAYIHLFRMAPYLENSRRLYRILDLTDAISREIARSLRFRSLLNRLLYSIEYPRIYQYERSVVNKFEETWFISEADRQTLVNDCPGANIQVVSNGIDTKRFFPTDISPNPFTILFTGHFGIAHNIDAAVILAKQALPLIQQVLPECKLLLVGAEPSPEVCSLRSLPGVVVTGFVEDLNHYLNQSTIFVAPLRFAAGIQNKVLEAMAAGRPVITTSIVNEGLGALPGKDLIIADDIDEIVSHSIFLIQNPDIAQMIGRSGYEFVTHRFTWNHVLERISMLSAEIAHY